MAINPIAQAVQPEDNGVGERTQKWADFLGNPMVQAGLMQFGVSMLSGKGFGAVGDGFAASGRVAAGREERKQEAAKLGREQADLQYERDFEREKYERDIHESDREYQLRLEQLARRGRSGGGGGGGGGGRGGGRRGGSDTADTGIDYDSDAFDVSKILKEMQRNADPRAPLPSMRDALIERDKRIAEAEGYARDKAGEAETAAILDKAIMNGLPINQIAAFPQYQQDQIVSAFAESASKGAAMIRNMQSTDPGIPKQKSETNTATPAQPTLATPNNMSAVKKSGFAGIADPSLVNPTTVDGPQLNIPTLAQPQIPTIPKQPMTNLMELMWLNGIPGSFENSR